jgi:hypothetical protein
LVAGDDDDFLEGFLVFVEDVLVWEVVGCGDGEGFVADEGDGDYDISCGWRGW